MSRNRKSGSAAIRFGPAVKAFLLCLFIGGSGVGYVWQKDQIGQLGQQMTRREARLQWLIDQNDKLRKQLAILRLPRSLMGRVEELGLGPPTPSQIWRLPYPVPNGIAPWREQQYAAKDRGGLTSR